MIFILSLWLLLKMTLTKLLELSKSIVAPGSSVRYILCRLADVPKSIISMFKKLQRRVWKGAGDSLQDSTYPYSEMRGALDKVKEKDKGKEQLDKAMKAPIDIERLRRKGLV